MIELKMSRANMDPGTTGASKQTAQTGQRKKNKAKHPKAKIEAPPQGGRGKRRELVSEKEL